jgi:hypothetical protein
MEKINLSRRLFINATAAASGLYAMSGASNLVFGETPEEVGLKNVPRRGRQAFHTSG